MTDPSDKDQGRRISESLRHAPGFSHPESLRGFVVLTNNDLTLGVTLGKPAFPLGLHRFEPVHGS